MQLVNGRWRSFLMSKLESLGTWEKLRKQKLHFQEQILTIQQTNGQEVKRNLNLQLGCQRQAVLSWWSLVLRQKPNKCEKRWAFPTSKIQVKRTKKSIHIYKKKWPFNNNIILHQLQPKSQYLLWLKKKLLFEWKEHQSLQATKSSSSSSTINIWQTSRNKSLKYPKPMKSINWLLGENKTILKAILTMLSLTRNPKKQCQKKKQAKKSIRVTVKCPISKWVSSYIRSINKYNK